MYSSKYTCNCLCCACFVVRASVRRRWVANRCVACRATLNVTQAFGESSFSGEGDDDDDNHQQQKPPPQQLHLSYDVTHPADAKIVKLDELGDVLVAVRCTPDALHLEFSSPDAAQAFHRELASIANASTAAGPENRVIVTGGPEWRCAKRATDHLQQQVADDGRTALSSPHGIILRKSSAAALARSLATGPAPPPSPSSSNDSGVPHTVVSFATEEAGYHEVFETASIRFRTSAFPQNAFHQHDHRHQHAVVEAGEQPVAPSSDNSGGDSSEERDARVRDEESVARRRLFSLWGSICAVGTKLTAAFVTAAVAVVSAVEVVVEVRV